MNEQLESTLTLASGIFLCTMLFSIFMEMLINGIDDIIIAIGNVMILFLTILVTTIWFDEFMDLRNKINEDEKPEEQTRKDVR